MTRISVLGAGAFGTALAITLARAGRPVTLWARSSDHAARIEAARENAARLPGVPLPETLAITGDIAAARAETMLLAVPAQSLGPFLGDHAAVLDGAALVSCCKGMDLATGERPSRLVEQACPAARVAVLTGPSFARDIARGLPTALTLACADPGPGEALQALLSTPTLRLYRTTDMIGAELGGALKNVMAIACGACIGEGMGDSARAALMTRGFAEMSRLAERFGGRRETLMGLSGLGDLVLTCTSEQSRNFRFGLALGRSETFAEDTTVEGVATARAMRDLARREAVDLPISTEVARLVDGEVNVASALQSLINRPLKEE